MKRLIAFALVLVMALSMMVMTASAALAAEAACTLHRENRHFKFSGDSHYNAIKGCPVFEGTVYTEYDGGSQNAEIDYPDFAAGNDPKETEAGNWWYMDANSKWNRCDGNHGTQPTAQPTAQPKTGVMDTLPIWFGVMAVSACAYVLTSKKRFF